MNKKHGSKKNENGGLFGLMSGLKPGFFNRWKFDNIKNLII